LSISIFKKDNHNT